MNRLREYGPTFVLVGHWAERLVGLSQMGLIKCSVRVTDGPYDFTLLHTVNMEK